VLAISLRVGALAVFPVVKMPKKKAPAALILDVQWSNKMIWELIDQIERNENWIVLLGKRKKTDISRGILALQQV